ncbi:catechol 2,3-dioxygenase-like lactoylglutathione lyase family enzyme [Saccharopolyspora gloriosae]|uniref:Catechol 2,3-dioxygenase-like lactoylglutathione lyase family enzyme n=1 Tax=Saccharopolyspora gloriosae TaxID=455344 RepID=A0A840NEK0_9PSEU|nr:VOC family protein [Saccharopolyspora gloriosae]MBB5068648.1 catechol 2,3-dioxygenase-like lactoylglutathione lyase family enzyme [Saccharopolyspora gloriosae]
MAILRMDHVGVNVEDLDGAVAFFTELGMEEAGRTPVEGPWVDRVNGIDDVRVDIVMMRTPDGHGQLELTHFRSPAAIGGTSEPPNALGLRSVMFAVDDVDDTVARLRGHGGELLGEIAQYEDAYRLCYVRGPGGVIVALAEPLG